MPEPRGVASVKTTDAAKRRLFRPTANPRRGGHRLGRHIPSGHRPDQRRDNP